MPICCLVKCMSLPSAIQAVINETQHSSSGAAAERHLMRVHADNGEDPIHIDQRKVLITWDPTTVGTKECLGPTTTSS